MFQTAVREPNPERPSPRPSRTPHPSARRYHPESPLATLRPHTTALLREDPLESTGRSSNWVSIGSVDAVAGQLEEEFKEEMNHYLRRKLKQLVGRKQQTVALDRVPQSPSRSERNRPLEKYYSWMEQEGTLEESGLEEAYLVNAKERIVRLIERKKQSETTFAELSTSIRQRCLTRDGVRGKVIRPELHKRTIEHEDWHREWEKDVQH